LWGRRRSFSLRRERGSTGGVDALVLGADIVKALLGEKVRFWLMKVEYVLHVASDLKLSVCVCVLIMIKVLKRASASDLWNKIPPKKAPELSVKTSVFSVRFSWFRVLYYKTQCLLTAIYSDNTSKYTMKALLLKSCGAM